MKTVKLFASLSIALIAFQACNKTDLTDATDSEYTLSTSTQTIDAIVEQNKTYKITLPSSVSGYTITTNAAHSSVSKVTTTGSSAEVYEYTPADSYTGTDAIVITGSDTTTEGGEHHGGCDKGNATPNGQAPAKKVRQQRININMTVTSPAASS